MRVLRQGQGVGSLSIEPNPLRSPQQQPCLCQSTLPSSEHSAVLGTICLLEGPSNGFHANYTHTLIVNPNKWHRASQCKSLQGISMPRDIINGYASCVMG